ncbi:MAG: ABC transporter ATP-binding protein [Promethearchaeota archaeon]
MERKKLMKFISYYKPHKKLIFLDLFCAVLVAGLDLVFPIFSNKFFNDFIPNDTPENLRLIVIYAIVLFILYIIRSIANYIMAFWGHMVGIKMEFDMRMDLFKHLQTQAFSFYDDRKTGQIMSRLVGDLREVSEMAHHGPEDILISTVMISISFVYLMFVNWALTLIIFLFVLLQLWFSLTKRWKMREAFRGTRKEHASINAKIQNSISGIRVCKSFANEEFEIDKFNTENLKYRRSYRSAYKIMAEFSAGNNFMMEILSLVALSVGSLFLYFDIPNATFNIPDLMTFLLFTAIFIRPIRRLLQFTQQYQMGSAGFERFYEMMMIKPEIMDKDDAIEMVNPQGQMEFRNLSFGYNEKLGYVLKNFNLSIQAGTTVALVGPSGVGKTTLTHLIPRFYDLKEGKGEILIDGVNIKDFSMDSIRKNIGFVQQDVFIFFGSIRDNILYGKPESSDEEVIEAAKQANLHEFIDGLPDGYDSYVGERGVKLSGGQKQRVALARIFLKNPPMLILDEATSSLDNATELQIQAAIERIAQNRTTVIVAHRLSTIMNADEIIVLEMGKIVERGSHEDLLKSHGLYAELYQAQFNGYVPNQFE